MLVSFQFMALASPGDHCRQPYHVDLHVHNPHVVKADEFCPVFLGPENFFLQRIIAI
jgi:hypothetical protein